MTEYSMTALRKEIKYLKRMATSGSQGRVYFDEPYLQIVEQTTAIVVPYKVAVDNGDLVDGQVACAL